MLKNIRLRITKFICLGRRERKCSWFLIIYENAGDNGEITTTHLLLGVWSQVGSPGYKILSALGFNDEKAQELKNVISEPGFVDD